MGTKNYVSIDTLKSNIWKPIELHKHYADDWTLNLRLDYLGYSIWRISPKYVVDLCLEDRWVSLDTLQAVSVSQPVDPNNGDYHHKFHINNYGNGSLNYVVLSGDNVLEQGSVSSIKDFAIGSTSHVRTDESRKITLAITPPRLKI